jgi:soluble lytic murein transglycosylase
MEPCFPRASRGKLIFMKKTIYCFLFSFSFFPVFVNAQNQSWEDLLHEGHHSDAYNLAKQQLHGPKADFYLGILALQNNNYDEAIDSLTKAIPANHDLNDYILFFRGQAHLAKGEGQKALEDFKKAESSTSLKYLGDVSQFYEAESYLALKQWKRAEILYRKELKKLRRTKYHPANLWGYLVAQVKNNKANKVCRQAKELYLKYPSFDAVSDWGIFLNDNTVNGKKLGCISTLKEQKLRIQRMLWAGLEEKTLGEIQDLMKRAGSQHKYTIDELMVSYLIHVGHIDEAQKLLSKYAKEKENDYDYLMLVGRVQSRSNTPQKGVDAYYKAYQLSKHVKQAAPSLFQSAFLSYQVGDYASATDKFKEYSSKYSNQRSYSDSQWYLAWLQYLQKDYVTAEKSFSEILEAKKSKPRLWSSHKEDKITFWIAMSQLRQGKKDQALELFSEMTHDEEVGYYSVAAYQRVRQMTGRDLASTAKTMVHENWWLPEAVAGAVKKDNEEDNLTEAEDPFVTQVDSILASEEKTDDALSDELVLQRIPQYLGKDIKSVYFNNLEKTMQRALALSRVGRDDLAYREVIDTEGNKLTNEQKQWLLKAHQSVNSYNRSVVLASYFYSDQIAKMGLYHGTDYWDYSYPRAYEKIVMKYSRQNQVPPELLWSIMRAETIFRPDAISPVGARGLMQVMPRTSRKLASIMGESVEVDDLLQPPVAIRYGAKYLSRLMTKFKGNVSLSAAAYNGGPHRVQAWMHYFGGLDMDEFIEHIPYQETRNYVKKVTKYYAIYNLLYKKKADATELLSKPIGFKFDGSIPTMETWERVDTANLTPPAKNEPAALIAPPAATFHDHNIDTINEK